MGCAAGAGAGAGGCGSSAIYVPSNNFQCIKETFDLRTLLDVEFERGAPHVTKDNRFSVYLNTQDVLAIKFGAGISTLGFLVTLNALAGALKEFRRVCLARVRKARSNKPTDYMQSTRTASPRSPPCLGFPYASARDRR